MPIVYAFFAGFFFVASAWSWSADYRFVSLICGAMCGMDLAFAIHSYTNPA